MTQSTTHTHEHCESCGATDYESLHTGDQGYTACCNETICDGRHESRFGNETHSVRACCWAVAEKKMAEQGIAVVDGMYRMSR